MNQFRRPCIVRLLPTFCLAAGLLNLGSPGGWAGDPMPAPAPPPAPVGYADGWAASPVAVLAPIAPAGRAGEGGGASTGKEERETVNKTKKLPNPSGLQGEGTKPAPGDPAPPASIHTANAAISPTEKLLPIDLPYALRLVNAANPTIALAQERVAEAYAVLKQTQVAWLPNIWLGGNPYAPTVLSSFYHHDGFIQNANGLVFFTDKNSFFLGSGVGMVLPFADAVFAPKIALRQSAAAVEARAKVVRNDIQLDVALAYLDLLRAYGALAINHEALQKAEEMLKAAESAFKRGLGKTGADPERARTEVSVLRQRRLLLQEDAARASAALAQLLLLDPSVDLLPGDQTVVPIVLSPTDCPIDELIAVALMHRPELEESRALIAAALERWKQAKYRPLFPILQASYGGGTFVGGTTDPNTAGGRNDVIATVSWELRNFGLGDLFASRERYAQYNQANFHALEIQSMVGAQVAAATKIVRQREKAVQEAQTAVRNAEGMWRKLEKIAFGIGLPARQYDALEPLLAEQALLQARTLYLDNVIEYNRNQFRLYWAMGQPPVVALPGAAAQSVAVGVLPPLGQRSARDTEKDKDADPKKKEPLLPQPRKGELP